MAKAAVETVHAKHVEMIFHSSLLKQFYAANPDIKVLAAIFQQAGINPLCELEGEAFIDKLIVFWSNNIISHSEALITLLKLPSADQLFANKYQQIQQLLGFRVRESQTSSDAELIHSNAVQVNEAVLAQLKARETLAHETVKDDEVMIAEFNDSCDQLESGVPLETVIGKMCTADIHDQSNIIRALLTYAIDTKRLDAVNILLDWENIPLLYNLEDEDNIVTDAITSFDCNKADDLSSQILLNVITHPAAKVIVDISYYETIMNMMLEVKNLADISSVQNKLYQRVGWMCNYYELCVEFADEDYIGNEMSALNIWFDHYEISDSKTQKAWVNIFRDLAIWQGDDPIMVETLDLWISQHAEGVGMPAVLSGGVIEIDDAA